MNIKKLRLQNKLSQNDVAKIINITQSNYSKYEKGTIEPDLKSLIQLANYYNVSLDYLCDRQWNNQIGYIQDDRRETVKQIVNLNDKSFDLVKSYTQAVIDMNEKKW